MSTHFTWQSAVLDSDCESSTKLVLLAIGSFMNQHGTGAFPSLETLATKTSLTKLTVRRHVQIAESIGWLAVKKRHTRNGDKDSNLYSIRYPLEVGYSVTHVGSPVTQGGLAINPQVGYSVTRNTPVLTPQVTPHKTERASRLSNDWEPSDEDLKFCRSERNDLNIRKVAAEFRDYWIAQPGAKGRKTDWPATWRNWVRRQRGAQPGFQNKQEKAKAFMDVLTGRTDNYDANDPFTIDAAATRVA